MVWQAHLRGIQWRVSIYNFCFHCQAGCFDLADSTAFMPVGCTLLYRETPPSLVIGNWTICSYTYQILWFQWVYFFVLFCSSRAWALHQPCLLAAPDNIFQSHGLTVTVVSHAGVDIGLGPFPFPWLVVYLKKWIPWPTTDLLKPRLLLFVSFTSLWMQIKVVGILPPTPPKHALTCPTFYLLCL